MIPQSEMREGGEGEATELVRRAMEEWPGPTAPVLRAQLKREPEWTALQKAALLLGSAALLLPTATTLLLLGALLPVDRSAMFALLVASSGLFLIVVQLAWKAHEALPKSLVPRLRDQLDGERVTPRALVQ